MAERDPNALRLGNRVWESGKGSKWRTVTSQKLTLLFPHPEPDSSDGVKMAAAYQETRILVTE